ncbi:MAG: OsmC family protein [Armatimonadetes bacterium]|nr:OsmC family protein [Armatimonadota bacterium]
MVTVNWNGMMAFTSEVPSGNGFTMDAYPGVGGENRGPTPVEALLSSIAACSAMDVISILRKKQQKVTGYQILIEGERVGEGTWPRPFTSIVIRHRLTGEDEEGRRRSSSALFIREQLDTEPEESASEDVVKEGSRT